MKGKYGIIRRIATQHFANSNPLTVTREGEPVFEIQFFNSRKDFNRAANRVVGKDARFLNAGLLVVRKPGRKAA